MKINYITIRNFRSIEKADICCSDFNIYVGQNNAGKTNLFEAVEWFYNGTPRDTTAKNLTFKRGDPNSLTVEITFSGAQDGAKKMLNAANGKKMLDVLSGSDSISVRRCGADEKNRIIIIDGTEIDKLPTGFDKAFNDFLPKFEYINTKQYFDAVAKYAKKTPVGIMLSGVLTTILEKSQRYKEFQQRFADLFEDEKSEIKMEFDKLGSSVRVHLEKQFPDCTKVSFEVRPPVFDDLLKNFDTSVDDGIETTADEKGDGMQRALMLAIIQAYSDFRKQEEDIGKSFLFFIDEAELHLHPTAQRKLKTVLLELAEQLDQVFINTHSSVFVADDHPQQTIHMVEKHDGASEVTPVSEKEKPYVVYELLGGSPSDLLLPRNFLIVEGRSEVELLTKVISRHYSDKKPIQIVPAEGDTHQAKRSINAIKKAFSPLRQSLYADKTVILCDKPSEEAKAGFEDFLDVHATETANDQIIVLPHGSLEECYPDREGWKRTSAQVASMSGQQKIKLARRVATDITKEEFETDMSACFSALTKAWEKAF